MTEAPETLADLLERGAALQTNPYLISPYATWREAAWSDIKAVLPPVLWEYVSGEAELPGDVVHIHIDVPGFAPIACSWHTYHKAFLGTRPFRVSAVAVDHPSIPEPFWNGGTEHADIETALVVARDRGAAMQAAEASYQERRRAYTAKALAAEEERFKAANAALQAEEAHYDGDWAKAPPRPWWRRLLGGAHETE